MGVKIEVRFTENVTADEASKIIEDIQDLVLERGLGVVTVDVVPADVEEPAEEERRVRENGDVVLSGESHDA